MSKKVPKKRRRATLRSDEDVANLQPLESGRTHHSAGGGLQLLVSKNGQKRWSVVYRVGEKTARVQLGVWPDLNFAAAIVRRDEVKRLVRQGQDPRRSGKYVRTFADLAELYMRLDSKPNKRTWREDQRKLDKILLPRWGDVRLVDIERGTVNAFCKEIASRTPTQGNRVYSLLRRMLQFACENEWLSVNPAAHCKKPAENRRRDRVLVASEIRTFWHQLPTTKMDARVSLALRLLLLTAQRAGEVAGMRWDEVDLEGRMWTLNASRAKNGRAHRIPLSDPVVELLTRAASLCGTGTYVFPSSRDDGSIRPPTLSHAIRQNRDHFGLAPFHAHDLRRTAATAMVEDGTPMEVISRILNHSERSLAGQIYALAHLDGPKCAALDRWAIRLEAIVGKSLHADFVI